MYTLHKTAFGKKTAYIISNPVSNQKITLIPEFGGIINELQLSSEHGAQNVLNGCEDEEALLTSPYYKNYWLIPFPNRLKDGQYTFEGKKYQFPINETGNQNSLHGFVERPNFDMRSTQLAENSAIITMGYTYKSEFDYYPFEFDFEVELTLADEGIFNTKITVKNIGTTNLPFGTGWHPYFKLDGAIVDDLALELPVVNLVECNDRMLPTGKEDAYTDFSTSKIVNSTRLDTCFRINPVDAHTKVTLIGKAHELSLWQNSEHYPFVQIYTPDDRLSIAIEPMTCSVNAFNNQDGVLVIAPNESKILDFGLSLKALTQNLAQ